jgi:hypothetical protein
MVYCRETLGAQFEAQKYVKWRTAHPRARSAFQRLAFAASGFSNAAWLGRSFAGTLITIGWTFGLRGTTETTKISE